MHLIQKYQQNGEGHLKEKGNVPERRGYLPVGLETCVQEKFYLGKAARIGECFFDHKDRD